MTDQINAIEATGLDVTMDGTPVLHDVCLTVAAGQTVALLGGNGSGKTTLLRTILGLLTHQAGQVYLFGEPLAVFRDWGRVGYVPQHGGVQVGNATINELVTSGRLPHRRWFHPLTKDDKTAVADALDMVNLTELSGQPVAHLSGGQRQRALIARALATRPDLVVLDEPLAGLDTDTQDSLAAVLLRLKLAGTAVLVVLHELGPLEPLLDSCTVLKAGRVIYTGALQSGIADAGHPHAHDDPGSPPPLLAPSPLAVKDAL